MLDYKLFIEDFENTKTRLEARSFTFDSDHFFALLNKRKELQQATQEIQMNRNRISKEIGLLKAKGQSTSTLMEEATFATDGLKQQEQLLTEAQAEFLEFQLNIPNLPHESVPIGKNEQDNVEVRQWGGLPQFDFIPQDHVALGERKGGIDFKAAAQISGSRFVVLREQWAQLHRALGEFMLDIHVTHHAYEELYVPYLALEKSLYGTGQLPKFYKEQFRIAGDSNLFLIPTAEVPLMNLVRDQILEPEELPKKWVTQTPCFRSEAGSYGQDVHGMIRQHQFQKVEIAQVVSPYSSYEALEELTHQAEKILQLLKLPYRVMALCTGDLGFSAAKTYDLEVWLPGQNKYREISSCSNCESFQARRLMARWRNPNTSKPEYVHTLNGSALAVGRTFIAVIENYQEANGRVRVPDVLKPYMRGIEYI
jgi:seryl-tRNA synthetase